MSPKFTATIVVSLLVPVLVPAQEHVDLNVIHKIKTAELGGGGRGGGGFGGGGGRGGSQVMEIMYNIADRYGPRLTNSPQFRAAGAWAVGQLKEWGLSNVHLENWSTEGGRGGPIPSWEFTGYTGAMVDPTYMPMIGYPQAWSGSTNGPVTAEAVLASIQTPADLDKYHGKLKGKIVLTVPPLELAFPTSPLAHRYTDAELEELVPEILPTGGAGRGGRGGRGQLAALAAMTPEERQAFTERQRNFWKDEGVLVTITASARGESGTVFAVQRIAAHRRPHQEHALGRHHRRKLQPHRPPAGAQRPGEALLRHQDRVRYDQDRFVQRDRRNSRHHQTRGSGDGGRPFRFLAHGHRRHR